MQYLENEDYSWTVTTHTVPKPTVSATAVPDTKDANERRERALHLRARQGRQRRGGASLFSRVTFARGVPRSHCGVATRRAVGDARTPRVFAGARAGTRGRRRRDVEPAHRERQTGQGEAPSGMQVILHRTAPDAIPLRRRDAADRAGRGSAVGEGCSVRHGQRRPAARACNWLQARNLTRIRHTGKAPSGICPPVEADDARACRPRRRRAVRVLECRRAVAVCRARSALGAGRHASRLQPRVSLSRAAPASRRNCSGALPASFSKTEAAAIDGVLRLVELELRIVRPPASGACACRRDGVAQRAPLLLARIGLLIWHELPFGRAETTIYIKLAAVGEARSPNAHRKTCPPARCPTGSQAQVSVLSWHR